jgi:hypothetical protein
MMKVLAACVFASAACANPALAQEPAAPPANGLTRDEVIAVAASTFDHLDLNHDGIITREEAVQARAALTKDSKGSQKAEEFLDQVFGSGQKIDQQSFVAAAVARFDANDPNHDGVITFEEHDAAKSRQTPK